MQAIYAPDGIDHGIDQDLLGIVGGLEFVAVGDAVFFVFVGIFG